MKQPRAWQRMLSGRRLDLLDPTAVDIELEDIAHGLAFVARWNGQTQPALTPTRFGVAKPPAVPIILIEATGISKYTPALPDWAASV